MRVLSWRHSLTIVVGPGGGYILTEGVPKYNNYLFLMDNIAIFSYNSVVAMI
ncbi:protein of unknown function [Candidatus Nitrotoga arctica]|uniref:Uncharacterized protein n=1 Tax=Candidatus Nitrotoga arctica TaxID=453162 RepID=A0ABN8AN46_9PROT|nr:protein of unknown function [Candidatus Nitrotoga arctica]